MKVLFKTFFLFILGAAADIHKKAFDRAIYSALAKYGNISSVRLIKMSDRSYGLYRRFRDMEKAVLRELA